MSEWNEMIRQCDAEGNPTQLALVLGLLQDYGCDCDADALDPCLACRCETVLHSLWVEVADLRIRLAAETGGEVDGWEWQDFPHKRWVLADSLAGWNIKVYRSGSQWTWYVDGLVFEQDADGESPTAWDAMRAAVAAYVRLRGEEDRDER